ncbi:MAG: hypothetical protein KF901_10140 [Myxococcales bacterium]|nr:hypothetical protein [Myxococcales bacterium]
MEAVFPWGPRLALATVVIVVGASVDRQLGRRGSGRLAGVDVDERPRDRAWRAAVRTLNGALALLALAASLTQAPIPAFVMALVACLSGPAALGLCARRALRRHDAEPALTPSVAHHLANGATIALAALFFRGVLPVLPAIIPLHWAGLGHGGYGPPTRLWWSLLLLAWGTGVMVFAARAARASRGSAWRRLAALRLAETSLLAFDLSVIALWIGVAVNGIPGAYTTRPAVLIAAAIMAGGLLLGVFGELRDRRRDRGSSQSSA